MKSLRDKIIAFLTQTAEIEPVIILPEQSFNNHILTSPVKEDSDRTLRERALREFAQQIAQCDRCPLSRNRTQVVFGVGNPQAQLMFVGEGPGADEDEQGEPFVGKAGQLLTQLISDLGMTRQEVYIANIVKCRPPGNREPTPEEAGTCLPYLLRQISIIQPKIIVALGKVAAVYLLRLNPSIAIKDIRGRLFSNYSATIIPTYHPAAVL
ncbi:MAG: uracil-DNA glycosylase family protein, partial [bacterium]